MLSLFLRIFIFIPVYLFTAASMAQVSPEVYLYQAGSDDEALDSSRYEVKTSDNSKPPQVVVIKKKKPQSVKPKPVPQVVEKKTVIAPAQPVVTDTVAPAKKSANKRPWQEVDPRFNFVQISLAPGYLYVDSESSSWYRDYYDSTPVISAKAEFIGFRKLSASASFLSSTAGDISAAPDSSKKTEVEHHQYDMSVLYRKYSANHRMASMIYGGVSYNSYEMKVKSTETQRVSVETKGLGLTLGARIPKTPDHAYTFESTFRPNLTIDEGGTAASYSSGSLESASAWDLSFKSEYLLSRKHIFSWSLQHQFEKSVYSGSSSSADPITGSAIEGVSVRSGRTFLLLGITWGD